MLAIIPGLLDYQVSAGMDNVNTNEQTDKLGLSRDLDFFISKLGVFIAYFRESFANERIRPWQKIRINGIKACKLHETV